MSLFFVFFALGPGILGFSLAYLLRYPEHWMEPALMSAVGLLATLTTQTWGVRWLRRVVAPRHAIVIAATRWGGLALGVVIGLMLYFVLLAQ